MLSLRIRTKFVVAINSQFSEPEFYYYCRTDQQQFKSELPNELTVPYSTDIKSFRFLFVIAIEFPGN